MTFFGTVYFLFFSERANFSFYFFLFFFWVVNMETCRELGMGCVSRKGTETLDGIAIELRLYLWARLRCLGSAGLQWASPLQALGLHLLWIPLIYRLDTLHIFLWGQLSLFSSLLRLGLSSWASTSYPAQGPACFARKWELGEPWFLVSGSSGEDWKYPALTTEEVQHCSEQRECLW